MLRAQKSIATIKKEGAPQDLWILLGRPLFAFGVN